MFAESILKFINFNLENFDLIQSFFYAIITLSFLLIIFWLVKDITSRFDNVFIRVVIFIGVIISNIPGVIFYVVLRPRETLVEKYERQILEKRQDALLLEEALAVCANCATVNKREFNFCTNCSRELNLYCNECKLPIQPYWKFCPKCRAVIKINLVEFKKKHVIFIPKFIKGMIDYVTKLVLNLFIYIYIWTVRNAKKLFNIYKNISKNVTSNFMIFKIDNKLEQALISATSPVMLQPKSQILAMEEANEINYHTKPRKNNKKTSKKRRKKKHKR